MSEGRRQAFIIALQAVMKMQTTLIQLSDLGPMSPMNARITLAQLHDQHKRIGEYLALLRGHVEASFNE